jgi:glycosyltransferase involved in cell wall biosynthesis
MLLSNTFRPDPRVLKEARGLISNGYGVTLLAWDREGNRPQEDTVGGVNVHRIRAIRIRGQLGMVIGMINFWAKAVLSSRKAAFDVVHAHDFDTLIPAVLISRLRRVPLVYDAHEHYSRMIAIDAPPAVMRLIDRLELRLVWSTDLVVTVSPPLATRFVAVGGPDVVIVTNCIDLPDASRVRQPSSHKEVVLFYGGTLEPMRYIEETIEAVKKTKGVRAVFAGEGRLSGLVAREAASNPNLEYLGYMDWNSLMERMVASDAVLCLLDPRNENYRIAIANRLCEGLAFGVPLLASKGTLCGEIVEAEGAGIAIEWSLDEFVRAVEELRELRRVEAMGRKGRKAAEREYNWEVQKAKLIAAYGRVMGTGRK